VFSVSKKAQAKRITLIKGIEREREEREREREREKEVTTKRADRLCSK